MPGNKDMVQAQLSIGVLIFGRKRPGFDQDWSTQVRNRCRSILDELGYQSVGADRVVMDDESVHATLDAVGRAGCQALIVIQPSLADGQYALTVSQRWRDPVILWATPERPGDGKVSSCSLVGQHLWASILRQANHPFELVYGTPEVLKDDLQRAITAAKTVHQLRSAKIGVVGTHAPGFLDLAADPFLIAQTFGLQLHPLSLPQFIERVQATPADAVAGDLQRVRALGLQSSQPAPPSDDLLAMNSRFYLSIQELMRESSLSALALQCWPELPNVLGTMAILCGIPPRVGRCGSVHRGGCRWGDRRLDRPNAWHWAGISFRLAGARRRHNFLLASGYGPAGHVQRNRLRR